MGIYGRNIAARPQAIRTYLFNDEWHTVPSEEFNAIERSGRSNWEAYAHEDPPAPLVHGALNTMFDRPGQTEPGSSPVYRELRGTAEVDDFVEAWLDRQELNRTDDRWTQKDRDKVWRMRQRGNAWWHIAGSLKRTEIAVKHMYRIEGKERGIVVNTRNFVIK